MTTYTQAHEQLSADLRDALLNGPARIVETPGYPGSHTAADLVLDHFSGESGEASLHELLRIVGLAAQGQDMHLRAAAWTAYVAKHHADFHADDLVERWESGSVRRVPIREGVEL